MHNKLQRDLCRMCSKKLSIRSSWSMFEQQCLFGINFLEVQNMILQPDSSQMHLRKKNTLRITTVSLWKNESPESMPKGCMLSLPLNLHLFLQDQPHLRAERIHITPCAWLKVLHGQSKKLQFTQRLIMITPNNNLNAKLGKGLHHGACFQEVAEQFPVSSLANLVQVNEWVKSTHDARLGVGVEGCLRCVLPLILHFLYVLNFQGRRPFAIRFCSATKAGSCTRDFAPPHWNERNCIYKLHPNSRSF